MSMDSALVSCAPRELESTQVSTWSSTGRHGHTTRTVPRQQCKDVKRSKQKNLLAATLQASRAVAAQQGSSLVTLAHALPSDIVAHIFLFSHLADVLNCAGLTCRTLHAGVWQQADFWVSLGGPAFMEVLTPARPLPMDASSVLAAFRRWVFGIQGGWSQDLQRLAGCESPLTALHDAHDRMQGLRQGEVPPADICRLVDAVVHAMNRLTVSDADAIDVAAALVARCRTRQDLFGQDQLSELGTTLGVIQERALQHKLDTLLPLDDDDDEILDPWEWESSANLEVHKQACAPIGGHTGRCLSLAFLAVMDDAAREGV